MEIILLLALAFVCGAIIFGGRGGSREPEITVTYGEAPTGFGCGGIFLLAAAVLAVFLAGLSGGR